MQPDLGKSTSFVLGAVGVVALIAAILNAFGIVKVVADDGTKFLLSLSVIIGVVLMFRDRLSKLTLPGGIVAELSAVRKTVEGVALATEELKVRQEEIVAPQMAPGAGAAAGVSGPAIAASSDRNQGRFGGLPARNGLVLTARVTEAGTRSGWFRVDLTVSAKNRALTHPVEFHLHETFAQPVQLVKPVAGEARLTVLAWGAFTVGAVTDQGKTQLELDLAADTSFPQAFRDN